jgi:lipoate-protein ligase A
MKFLDLTLPSPEENLACDEALLEACESRSGEEVLRFWEPAEYFVVLGYANRHRSAVNLAVCEARNIPILRRCSGGGTVLQGPGCLNYSLILRIVADGPFSGITETNTLIMQRNCAALQTLLSGPVRIQGVTDLTVGSRKFSGNAQRRRRACLLFHGTFLLTFDLPLVDAVLATPPSQPDYRQNRDHQQFLTNLNLAPALVKQALQNHWDATQILGAVPFADIECLRQERYALAEWNYRF